MCRVPGGGAHSRPIISAHAVDFYQGIPLLKWVFSLGFQGFLCLFDREIKSLVNLEVS